LTVDNSANSHCKKVQSYLGLLQTGSKVVTYSPRIKFKPLQIFEFEGVFLVRTFSTSLMLF
jgi:hypothetical protein